MPTTQAKQIVLWMTLILLPTMGSAQSVSGSTGTDGPLVIDSNTTLPVPEPDGVFNFTTITIEAGATLSFTPNSLNTPVYLLATGDVTINGVIDVKGKDGSSSPPIGGAGGPGGFAGGTAGNSGQPAGDGQGPGAGKRGTGSGTSGRGAYGRTSGAAPRAADGRIYGSPFLVPLVGGSGGGGHDGTPGMGGGGGGGAVLIASDTQITLSSTGRIELSGGGNSGNAGSGGAARLVAPKVRGSGSIIPQSVNGFGGPGRVRIDVIDRSELQITVTPSSVYSVGSFMRVFPDPLPRLDLIHVAGTAIPEGAANAVNVFLPLNSPASQLVRVQGRDFAGMVPIRVTLTPESGSAVVQDATLNMTTNPATVDLTMSFPLNTTTHVQAFTR